MALSVLAGVLLNTPRHEPRYTQPNTRYLGYAQRRQGSGPSLSLSYPEEGVDSMQGVACMHATSNVYPSIMG